MLAPLKEKEIVSSLKSLKRNWVQSENQKQIELMISLENYDHGISLVQSIGKLANENWHHPELCLSFKNLTIKLWTHDVQALTKKDFDLAHLIEKLLP
jgi:4a-hydroxytetrahydrobiopterin dehydratase